MCWEVIAATHPRHHLLPTPRTSEKQRCRGFKVPKMLANDGY